MRDYTQLSDREIFILILQAIELQTEVLQVIANKPSYAGKPQKPKLGDVQLSPDGAFLWLEVASVFGAERKFDKDATAARKQAVIVHIQLLAGQDIHAINMREISLEKEGKDGKPNYTVKALRFIWNDQTKKVFSALLTSPIIDGTEYYIKGLKEIITP